MYRIISIVLSLIAVGTIGTLLVILRSEQWSLPIWAYVVPVTIAAYLLITTFVVASEKARGPSCKVGPFTLDPPNKIFHLPIKNGNVRARIRVSINNATDSWQEVEHLSHSVEPFWWERPKAYEAVLQPGGRERSLLLLADHHARPSGHPSLFVLGNKEGNPIPVSRDVPLSEQGIVTLSVGITCESVPTDKESKVEMVTMSPLTLSVAPDLEHPEVGYKIVRPSARWFGLSVGS